MTPSGERRRGGRRWQRLTRQRPRRQGPAERWYALSADDVAARLGVDPASGLSAAKAAELLQKNGPNELPAEKAEPGWRRFLDQYRAYMQIILLDRRRRLARHRPVEHGRWCSSSLTVFNAVVGLRQEGKAESAMNALKSLMKQTARVRRDGAEAEIPAEEVVVGDVVLLERRRRRAGRRQDHRGAARSTSTSPRSPARACRPPRRRTRSPTPTSVPATGRTWRS